MPVPSFVTNVLITSMFQNDLYTEPVITVKWYWPTLGWGTLQCCLQTNVLPHWLVTSILQCIPLHH